MINRIVLNETSYFGRGSRKKLGEELKARGLNKVLLVTDFTLMEANVTKMVIDVLENAGILDKIEEAKTYYYKCGYEIADNYFEAGDLEKSLDAFYKVKAYEDSATRLSEIATLLYDSAMSNYNIKNYNEALVGFTFLSKYNFKGE